ncbi:MAG: nitroreductase family deazaflavin-dependent oxidoreductase [Actinomycetota bacterium]
MTDFLDFNKGVIEEFRANDGVVGGPMAGMPIMLLNMIGAKTGRELCSPLVYSTDDGDVIVIASKGGAPQHPHWYHNLVANPDVTVEVGTDRYTARAELVEGDERDRLYAAQAAEMPQFADYAESAAKVGRVIPVFRLVRTGGSST